MFTRNKIALFLVAILVLGAGLVVYYGRPVMKIADGLDDERIENEQADDGEERAEGGAALGQAPASPVSAADQNQGAAKTYSLAQVEQHASRGDCWAAVNGGVYDLTTWVDRHPGGADKIIGLCGTDGSAKFNRKHGSFAPAQAALVLLKIGDLK